MTLKFFSSKTDTLEMPFEAIELTDEELASVDGGHGDDSCNSCNSVDWNNDRGGHHHGGHHHGGHHHGGRHDDD